MSKQKYFISASKPDRQAVCTREEDSTQSKLTTLTVDITGLEGWRLLHQVAQLKWTLIAKGQPVMNESEMASLILSILISVCR